MTEPEILKHIETVNHTFTREQFPTLEQIDQDLESLRAAGYIDEAKGEAFLRKFGPSAVQGHNHLVLIVVLYGLSRQGKQRLEDLTCGKAQPTH